MLNRLLSSNKAKDPLIVIIVSVIISTVLMVYPLPYTVAGWRPHILFLITIFWVLCQPMWCGVWFAFMMGMMTDLLLNLPLGSNALSFVILTFLARQFTREFAHLHFVLLWLVSSLAVLIYVLVMWIAFSLADINFIDARHWQPLLSSIMIFPFVYWILKKWKA